MLTAEADKAIIDSLVACFAELSSRHKTKPSNETRAAEEAALMAATNAVPKQLLSAVMRRLGQT